jgi:two-component system, cell cycle response regulator CpdR
MSIPYTVLFVEDDVGVRESTSAILALHDVRLFVAKDGYEALDILAREHVDVLFTDVVMPDLNGIDLAKRALGHQPDLKVMFMTAYYSRAGEAQRLGKVLFKPLRAREIEAELDELLAAR